MKASGEDRSEIFNCCTSHMIGWINGLNPILFCDWSNVLDQRVSFFGSAFQLSALRASKLANKK